MTAVALTSKPETSPATPAWPARVEIVNGVGFVNVERNVAGHITAVLGFGGVTIRALGQSARLEIVRSVPVERIPATGGAPAMARSAQDRGRLLAMHESNRLTMERLARDNQAIAMELGALDVRDGGSMLSAEERLDWDATNLPDRFEQI